MASEDLIKSSDIDIINAVLRLNDEATIPGEWAAKFLNISLSKLKRLRQTGNGPVYIQYPEDGTTARNQKVHYIISDLKKWRDSHRVNSSISAAQKRRMTFTCEEHLVDEVFFVINTDMDVWSPLYFLSPDQLFKVIENNINSELVEIPWAKALGMRWSDEDARQIMKARYLSFLDKLRNQVTQV